MSSPTKPVQNILELDPRGRVVATVKNNWLATRDSAYKYVKRGPVNWAAFDFEKYPRAVAILIDEADIFSRHEDAGTQQMLLSMEIMAALPPEEKEEMDDGLLDQMYRDTRKVLTELFEAKAEDVNMPIAIRQQAGTDRAVETHDATIGVQGLIAMLRIDF